MLVEVCIVVGFILLKPNTLYGERLGIAASLQLGAQDVQLHDNLFGRHSFPAHVDALL
jgi:hypothetical protein